MTPLQIIQAARVNWITHQEKERQARFDAAVTEAFEMVRADIYRQTDYDYAERTALAQENGRLYLEAKERIYRLEAMLSVARSGGLVSDQVAQQNLHAATVSRNELRELGIGDRRKEPRG